MALMESNTREPRTPGLTLPREYEVSLDGDSTLINSVEKKNHCEGQSDVEGSSGICERCEDPVATESGVSEAVCDVFGHPTPQEDGDSFERYNSESTTPASSWALRGRPFRWPWSKESLSARYHLQPQADEAEMNPVADGSVEFRIDVRQGRDGILYCEPPKLPPGGMRIFVLTYITYATLYATRKPFSVVKEEIQAELSISTYALGCIDTAFLGWYALGQLLVPVMLRIISAKHLRTFISSCYLFSFATTLLFGMSSTPMSMVVLWGLNGIAHAPIFPIFVKFLSEKIPAPDRGALMGLWTTSQQVGALGATAFAASVDMHFGWRCVFSASSVLCIGAAFLLMALLPSSRTQSTNASSVSLRHMSQVKELAAKENPIRWNVEMKPIRQQLPSEAPSVNTSNGNHSVGLTGGTGESGIDEGPTVDISVDARENTGPSHGRQETPLCISRGRTSGNGSPRSSMRSSPAPVSPSSRSSGGDLLQTPCFEDTPSDRKTWYCRNARIGGSAAAPRPYNRLRTSGLVLLCSLAYFGVKFIRYSLLFWLPYFLSRQANLSVTAAGFSSMVFDVGGVAGAIVGGLLADKLLGGRRLSCAAFMCVGTGLCLLLVAFSCQQQQQMQLVQQQQQQALSAAKQSLERRHELERKEQEAQQKRERQQLPLHVQQTLERAQLLQDEFARHQKHQEVTQISPANETNTVDLGENSFDVNTTVGIQSIQSQLRPTSVALDSSGQQGTREKHELTPIDVRNRPVAVAAQSREHVQEASALQKETPLAGVDLDVLGLPRQRASALLDTRAGTNLDWMRTQSSSAGEKTTGSDEQQSDIVQPLHVNAVNASPPDEQNTIRRPNDTYTVSTEQELLRQGSREVTSVQPLLLKNTPLTGTTITEREANDQSPIQSAPSMPLSSSVGSSLPVAAPPAQDAVPTRRLDSALLEVPTKSRGIDVKMFPQLSYELSASQPFVTEPRMGGPKNRRQDTALTAPRISSLFAEEPDIVAVSQSTAKEGPAYSFWLEYLSGQHQLHLQSVAIQAGKQQPLQPQFPLVSGRPKSDSEYPANAEGSGPEFNRRPAAGELPEVSRIADTLAPVKLNTSIVQSEVRRLHASGDRVVADQDQHFDPQSQAGTDISSSQIQSPHSVEDQTVPNGHNQPSTTPELLPEPAGSDDNTPVNNGRPEKDDVWSLQLLRLEVQQKIAAEELLKFQKKQLQALEAESSLHDQFVEDQAKKQIRLLLMCVLLVGFFVAAPDSVLGASAAQDLLEVSGSCTTNVAVVASFINAMGAIGALLQGILTAAVSECYGWDALFGLLCLLSLCSALLLLPAALQEGRRSFSKVASRVERS